MELIKSKTGEERVIERINFEKIRVTGKSKTYRKKEDNGAISLFDFDGGPHYNVGGGIRFEKLNYIIKGITQNETTTDDLVEIVLKVTPKY